MNISSVSTFQEWAQALTQHMLFDDAIWAAVIYALVGWFLITLLRFKRYKNSDFDDIQALKNRLIINGVIAGLICIVITLALDILGAVTHDQHSLSLFLFPILGLLGSYIIDNKFNTGKLIEKFDEQRAISATNSFRHDEELRERFLQQSVKDSEFTKLKEEDTQSPRYKEKLRLIIDELQLKTAQQDEQLNKIESTVVNNQNDISAIKNSLLADKYLQISDLIYQCLGMGFTTVELDNEIKVRRKAYKLLGGNGDLDEIYEKYKELNFKED